MVSGVTGIFDNTPVTSKDTIQSFSTHWLSCPPFHQKPALLRSSVTSRQTFNTCVSVATFADFVALGTVPSLGFQNISSVVLPSIPLTIQSVCCKFFLYQIFKYLCSQEFILFPHSSHPFHCLSDSHLVLWLKPLGIYRYPFMHLHSQPSLQT